MVTKSSTAVITIYNPTTTTTTHYTSLTEGIQNMMGIQNVAAIFCISLIPYCWGTKYGSHILYPLKDQRGDTEYDGDTKCGCHILYPINPLLFGYKIWQPHFVSRKRSKGGYRIWQAYRIWRYRAISLKPLSAGS